MRRIGRSAATLRRATMVPLVARSRVAAGLKPVGKDVDLAIVSQGNPYRAVVGGPYLAEGESAVIDPRGADGFRVIARIRGDEWRALAAAH